jgi:hypothetical protein
MALKSQGPFVACHTARISVAVKSRVRLRSGACSTPAAGLRSIKPWRSAQWKNACSERQTFFAVVAPLLTVIAAQRALTIAVVMAANG